MKRVITKGLVIRRGLFIDVSEARVQRSAQYFRLVSCLGIIRTNDGLSRETTVRELGADGLIAHRTRLRLRLLASR